MIKIAQSMANIVLKVAVIYVQIAKQNCFKVTVKCRIERHPNRTTLSFYSACHCIWKIFSHIHFAFTHTACCNIFCVMSQYPTASAFLRKGIRKRPSWETIFKWVDEAAKSIAPEVIAKSFVCCGIKKNGEEVPFENLGSRLRALLAPDAEQNDDELAAPTEVDSEDEDDALQIDERNEDDDESSGFSSSASEVDEAAGPSG